MISYIGVLPYAHQPYFEECWRTIRPPLRDNIYPRDNTKDNIGVAESWDRGIYYMYKYDADWLIIFGASMRFGPTGGLDILQQLDKHPLAMVVHFATKNTPEQDYIRGVSPGFPDVFGWHLTAIHRDIIDEVGYFDPNFYPIYFEDIDYDLRINKAFPAINWKILPIDAQDTVMGHAEKKAGIKADSTKLIAYFAEKWGRHPNAAELGDYDYPFNDPNNSLKFFPPARGRLWDEV